MNSVIYGGKSWGVGTEKLTEVDTSGGGGGGGRSKKVNVNHPKFFDRYSRSIEQ